MWGILNDGERRTQPRPEEEEYEVSKGCDAEGVILLSLTLVTRPEDGRAHPHQGSALGDRRLQIV